jgi:4-amino-4-deoxy-L-arabinose transferase-like glycosyltransferase
MLMAAAAAQLGWIARHNEPTFADGLRYIHQAERIQSGAWGGSLLQGVDHPLHAVGIAAAHWLTGGADPASWQRAALVLSFTCAILLVIPSYLLSLELFGERTAWLASLLFSVNPVVADIVVNVLSESTFLLWWTLGLWTAVRFLREGRFFWLPAVIGLGALAYLTRPEGMLLPAALTATLLLSPLWRATRIEWPRWWRALAFLAGGLVIGAGPYIAIKGGVGTKPGIARVLGLAPHAQPLGLERGKPVPPDQSIAQTYHLAGVRMLRAMRVGVTTPLFPFALVGLVLAARMRGRARAMVFLALVLVASALALVRLHATGGYCTARHGLVPVMLLTLAAAHSIVWIMTKIANSCRWYGLSGMLLQHGRAAWTALIVLLIFAVLKTHDLGPLNSGPFSVYRATGEWLARHANGDEHVLDLTGWPLFFSGRPGYSFSEVYDAPADPRTRWIVVRQPHVDGHWYYSHVLRDLLGGRDPVALVPAHARANQVQIRIYDRRAPLSPIAARTAVVR